MKKIIAFGASSSKNSINKQFAAWAASRLDGVDAQVLDLNNFEMPIYSIDKEMEGGIPQLAKDFKELVNGADGIIVSFAEHNGAYSAAFKNILDWMSRIGAPTWSDKPMLLLATSPGGRGGAGVLGAATGAFPHQGAKVTANFSLPSFGSNFDNGITDSDLSASFERALAAFYASI